MSTTKALHGTTILAVRHRGGCAIAGDGQVSMGRTVMKHGAKKIRRRNLERASVELAREWRTDRVMRRLEAFLIVADRESSFLLSGAGDVIAPDDGIVAVGSGGSYALAAARALARHTSLDAPTLALEAMKVAAQICIYTNDQITVESL